MHISDPATGFTSWKNIQESSEPSAGVDRYRYNWLHPQDRKESNGDISNFEDKGQIYGEVLKLESSKQVLNLKSIWFQVN